MEYTYEFNPITMTVDDVPVWLRQSELYRNFQEGEGEFQVNSDCIVSTSKIDNIDDFRKVIQAYTFWIVDKIPDTAFRFVLVGNNYQQVKQMFSNYRELWDKLDMFYRIDRWNTNRIYFLILEFASRGYTDCIEFCLSISHDESKEEVLLCPDIYIEVITSELEPHVKVQAINELKRMGFPLPHTRYLPFDIDHMECFILLHKNGACIDRTTIDSILDVDVVYPKLQNSYLSYTLEHL